ncbi:squalene synthase HpnC [Undibacterium sp. LX40W]|uniref:Squalene synthase HpnC n=1 Tax=Undibacterium nitidum TaxID=2762298 RepID=A0A923HXG8_9BURK|nr:MULTISPECIES: squalene synthase HpnC [Undibacterium]MBC3883209.1 squalene synthase HpnC [Undibacterium nitidum]MBC3893491.1 squalene synthase HpnC [Undibacterium sp. LX40W]
MTISHYENFPVASWLMPAHVRPAVRTVYAFARSADDFADEGNISDEQRLELLNQYEYELDAIQEQRPITSPLFQDLAKVVEQYEIPLQLFRDLLSAFKQDVVTKRYTDFETLLDYCRRSANPVGRIMLRLFSQDSASQLVRSDLICTSLQLINFWQDVAIDLDKSRIYLPQEDMRKFDIDEKKLDLNYNRDAWRALMQFEVDRARQMMINGSSLALELPGRFGFELRMIVQGGLLILDKLEKIDFDVFNKRPTIKKIDAARLMWRSLKM